METLTRFVQYLETERVLAFLRSEDMADLMHNPWVLGGLVLFAVIALFMKWRGLLALVFSVAGFGWLISYTMQQDTSLSNMSNQSLLIFVGAGVGMIFVVIYLLFIKTD